MTESHERVIESKKKVIESHERVIEKFAKNGDKFTENRLSIIRLMLADPNISKAELADKVGISVKSVSENIEYMRGKYIKRIGPDKGGHWEVIED